jgi:hypothetical protein
VAKIIAGRFEFDMQAEGGDSVLHVTDGRFDIKYE